MLPARARGVFFLLFLTPSLRLGLLGGRLALRPLGALGGREDEALDGELHEEVEVGRVPVYRGDGGLIDW